MNGWISINPSIRYSVLIDERNENMIYNTKAEFMAALQREAARCSLPFEEMAEDFERHFSEGAENGESESEICAKLGDPAEIVKEYAGEAVEDMQYSESTPHYTAYETDQMKQDNGRISGGMITGVILLDLLVLDWVLPTLAALVITYIAVAFAFIVSGVASIISVMLPFVSDSVTSLLFGGIFNVFAGMVILGLGGIMAAFTPNIIKGFAGVIKAVARLHVRAFTGRKAGF